MSRSCRIRIQADALPAPATLKAALRAAGYPLDPEGLKLASASGFQGCILDGEDAGFSITRETDGLTLRWAGDPREELAALMVAEVLTRHGAALSDASDQPLAPTAVQARITALMEAR